MKGAMFVFELVYLIIAVVLLYLIVKMLSLPLTIVYNGLVGAVMLWLINLAGSFFAFSLEINIVNSLIAGFLGVPGVVFLVIAKLFFGW